MAIALPDPPLQDGVVALRAWRVTDAPALVSAWGDADIRRWTGVPERRTLAAALRWISGEARRRRNDVAVDLVACRADDPSEVLGEVGLAAIDRIRGVASVGYWIVPQARGTGVAARGLRLVTAWALTPAPAGLGLRVLEAEIDHRNAASLKVAQAAGYGYDGTTRPCSVRVGDPGEMEVWRSWRDGER